MANFCDGFDAENETWCFSTLSMIINHLVRRKTRTKPTIDWQLEVRAFYFHAAFSFACESDKKSATRQKGLRRIKIPENTRSTVKPGLDACKVMNLLTDIPSAFHPWYTAHILALSTNIFLLALALNDQNIFLSSFESLSSAKNESKIKFFMAFRLAKLFMFSLESRVIAWLDRTRGLHLWALSPISTDRNHRIMMMDYVVVGWRFRGSLKDEKNRGKLIRNYELFHN